MLMTFVEIVQWGEYRKMVFIFLSYSLCHWIFFKNFSFFLLVQFDKISIPYKIII